MSCKYPKESINYNSCLRCSSINCCGYAVIPMPEVQPPKNVIPSALEANKMTNHVIYDDTQLEDIGKEIREAIEEGKFFISGMGYLETETRKKLEELGYNIQVDIRYNGAFYNVSWEEAQ